MNPDMRILTVTSYGETEEDNSQVTLAPMSIKMCASKNGKIQGRDIKKTLILFVDSDEIELNLNDLDLMQIQSVIGSYGYYNE